MPPKAVSVHQAGRPGGQADHAARDRGRPKARWTTRTGWRGQDLGEATDAAVDELRAAFTPTSEALDAGLATP